MPKKFNFKLEPVLKLRAQDVKIAEDSLNKVVRVRLQTEDKISFNKNYHSEIALAGNGKNKAADLQNNYHHRKKIEDEIKYLESEIVKIEEIENLRRNKLNKAMQLEKVIVKLKDKKQNEYNYEIQKEETNLMDEIGNAKHERDLNKNGR